MRGGTDIDALPWYVPQLHQVRMNGGHLVKSPPPWGHPRLHPAGKGSGKRVHRSVQPQIARRVPEHAPVLVDRLREEHDRGVASRLQPASAPQLAGPLDAQRVLKTVGKRGRRSRVFPAVNGAKAGPRTKVGLCQDCRGTKAGAGHIGLSIERKEPCSSMQRPMKRCGRINGVVCA